MYFCARLGASVEVDDDLWKKNPSQAFYQALQNGNVHLDGETYFVDESGQEIESFDVLDYIPIQINRSNQENDQT